MSSPRLSTVHREQLRGSNGGSLTPPTKSRYTKIASKCQMFRFDAELRALVESKRDRLHLNPAQTALRLFSLLDYRGLYQLYSLKPLRAKTRCSTLPILSHIRSMKVAPRPTQRRTSLANFSTVISLIYLPRAYSLFGDATHIGPFREIPSPGSSLSSLFLASIIAQVTLCILPFRPLCNSHVYAYDSTISCGPMCAPRYRVLSSLPRCEYSIPVSLADDFCHVATRQSF